MDDLHKISNSAIENIRHTFDKAFYEDLKKRIDGLEESVVSLANGIKGNKKKIEDLTSVTRKVFSATKNTYEETDTINSFLSGDETTDDLEDLRVSDEFSLAELILIMNQYQNIKLKNEVEKLKEETFSKINKTDERIESYKDNLINLQKETVSSLNRKIENELSTASIEHKEIVSEIINQKGILKTEFDEKLEKVWQKSQCLESSISNIGRTTKDNNQKVEEMLSKISSNHEDIKLEINLQKRMIDQHTRIIKEIISITERNNREEIKQYVDRLELKIKILLSVVTVLFGFNIYLFLK